jgi:hypothetical protein
MGLSGKNSESNDYKLRQILRDELGKVFVYDRVEDEATIENKRRRSTGSPVITDNFGGYFIVGGNAKGDVSSYVGGNVSFAINELPSSSEPDKPGIKELLTQLQAEIKADPNLSEDDREDALEQVKDLAEAAKNPNDAEMKNKAKKADRMLGRIISAVPQATKLLEFCNNLLPLITKVFGF